MGSGDTLRTPASAGSGGVDNVLAGTGDDRAAGGGGHAAGSGWSNVVDLVMGSGATPRIPCPEYWHLLVRSCLKVKSSPWSLGPELGQQKG